MAQLCYHDITQERNEVAKMRSDKICVADLHLHTNLSFCAPSDTTLNTYLPHCAQEGLKKIGISNHLYADSDVDRILQIHEEIRALQDCLPVQILIGCEVESRYGQEPTLKREYASKFDYVLLAPSHIFNQLHEYKDFDLSTSDKIRQLLMDNFKRACLLEFGVPTAIAHPLYPIVAPNQQEILDSMTDEQLAECYTLAAEHDKSIEIHACLYRDTVTLDEEGLSPSYIRMLSIAKECGCKFHFGSDAHRLKEFANKHCLLERAAERAGICEDDLWHLARI